LIFDFRSAEGHLEHLPQLALDFVESNPNVIVTGFGTATAKAAQAATTSIPVVFTSVGDPIGSGIIRSLNRPGANITGLHVQGAEISGKRLQILEELSPGIRIVAVLLEPDAPFTSVALPQLRSAAEARRHRLAICEVRTADQLTTSVEAAAQAGARGLVMLETPLLLELRPANFRCRSQAAALCGLQQPGICGGRWIAVVWGRIVGSCIGARQNSSVLRQTAAACPRPPSASPYRDQNVAAPVILRRPLWRRRNTDDH
jgi:hypothetical protein